MFDPQSAIILYGLLAILVIVFVAVFFHFWLRARRIKQHVMPRILNSVFLEIQVPKENADKEDKPRSDEEKKNNIAVAEQIFTTLSGIGQSEKFFGYDDYISFEIAAAD